MCWSGKDICAGVVKIDICAGVVKIYVLEW